MLILVLVPVQIQHLNCPWSKDSPHIVFDFHQECRGNTEALPKKLQPRIKNEMETFGYFTSKKGQVLSVSRWINECVC